MRHADHRPQSISPTAFIMPDGQLVDIVALSYQHRRPGAACHRIGNAIQVLTAIADELHRGIATAGQLSTTIEALKKLQEATRP